MDSRFIKPTPALMMIFLLAFFLTNPGWSASAKQNVLQASLTPAAASPTLASSATGTITTTPAPKLTPTLTPLPEEYQETPDQTIGILFGAVFLVIIIVGGTFFTIRRKR